MFEVFGEKYRGISLRLWSRQIFFNQVKKAFTLNKIVRKFDSILIN